MRAELEDLADDDDDDDDDAKKKSLKLSWVYIKPSARNNFFFCRVGRADARFSISKGFKFFFCGSRFFGLSRSQELLSLTVVLFAKRHKTHEGEGKEKKGKEGIRKYE